MMKPTNPSAFQLSRRMSPQISAPLDELCAWSVGTLDLGYAERAGGVPLHVNELFIRLGKGLWRPIGPRFELRFFRHLCG